MVQTSLLLKWHLKVESHSNSKHSNNGLGLVRYFNSFVIQMSVIQIPTVLIFKPPEFALQRNIERVSYLK